MERSQTISELAKALVQFQLKCKTIGYDASNPFFKSKYATLTALVSETKHELSNAGLAVSQLCEDEGAITTILMHVSGEFISSKLTLKPVKDDPQGRGSCLTYSRRYAYAAILGLVSDDDDDANAATSKPQAITVKDEEKMIHHVTKLAKEKFADPDLFKAWRVENNYAENLNKLDELQLAIIWNALKKVVKK